MQRDLLKSARQSARQDDPRFWAKGVPNGDCLEYALMNDERFGIWGGLSERERRKLKKRAV